MILPIRILFLLLVLLVGGPVLASDTIAVQAQDTTVAVEPSPVILPAAPAPEIPFFQRLMADPLLPFAVLVVVALLFLWVYFQRLTLGLSTSLKEASTERARCDFEEAHSTASATLKVLKYFLWLVLIGYPLYIAVRGTSMEGYVKEWLNLAVRWTHVIAGIMWIGASFYFIFLENNLNRTKGLRDELAGNLWAIHGGGFYFLEKYKVAPGEIPKDLHWFKYEAYFTWLSGFVLLFIVYYMDARAFMVDPSVAELDPAMAVGIGIGSLAIGWVIYDIMCRSRLILRQDLFALVGTVVLGVITYALFHLMSGRAAYIHVGAILGTVMVGNVFFNIIPSQKALVKAARTGMPLDSTLGKKAGQRSLHNNYITLPVVFIMISNHFPSTFGHSHGWLVLMVLIIASAGIKHYWNLLDRGESKPRVLVLSIAALVTLSFLISPAFEDTLDTSVPVSFREANMVIQQRCVQCHSAAPTDDDWRTAPNGVMYDTPEQIQSMADQIMARAVRSKSMPLGNKTGMTEEERTVLRRWILQGAKVE
jgi:uncharacterized membrane protein